MPRRTPFLIALSLCAICTSRSPASEPDAAELAAQIDRQIETRLASEHLPPADLADDAEFLRRVCLDLHGVVPTAEQAASFLSAAEPNRRTRLIDSLLASPRYGEHLGDIWQGYLVSPLADDQRARAERFSRWLAEQFNNRTWDRIATELLIANGKMEDNPAIIYLIEGRLPRTVPDMTDLASRYFLGLRLSCSQCHDHPFAAWKQRDYWGLAAFFTQIQTPGRSKQVYQLGLRDDPKITLASLRDSGAPDGFQLQPPTFLGGQTWPGGEEPHRVALAKWMTSPENPYFARAMVNRTWWRLFGRGLVQPVDDMHAAHAPSHPELLDLLARRFVESGFDLKFLTRAMVSSQAYQRTSRPGVAPPKQVELFGRMSVKVLSAGQLYDSLTTILGPPAKAPRDARAEFTQFFGEQGDPEPTAYRRGIPHLLRQMNSGQFAGRNLTDFAARLTQAGRSADDIANDLFVAILSRRPTSAEVRMFQDHVARSASTESACRELAAALLLTSEFSLNH